MIRMTKNGTEDVAEVVAGGSASDDELWEAAKACPWAAVVLEDDSGQQLYP